MRPSGAEVRLGGVPLGGTVKAGDSQPCIEDNIHVLYVLFVLPRVETSALSSDQLISLSRLRADDAWSARGYGRSVGCHGHGWGDDGNGTGSRDASTPSTGSDAFLASTTSALQREGGGAEPYVQDYADDILQGE